MTGEVFQGRPPGWSVMPSASAAPIAPAAGPGAGGLLALANPALAVLGVASMVLGAVNRRKEKKAMKRANAREARLRAIEQRRQRIALARERQVAQAEVVNAAAQTGTMGSSGAAQALASTDAQYGERMAYLNTVDIFGRKITQDLAKAAGYGNRATTADALFNTALLGYQLQQKKE